MHRVSYPGMVLRSRCHGRAHHRVERSTGRNAIIGTYYRDFILGIQAANSHLAGGVTDRYDAGVTGEGVGSGLGNSPRGPGNWQQETGSNRQPTAIALKRARC
jgi:hypothetical protein